MLRKRMLSTTQHHLMRKRTTTTLSQRLTQLQSMWENEYTLLKKNDHWQKLLRAQNRTFSSSTSSIPSTSKDDKDYEKMTVIQLKNELRTHGLKVTGKKRELIDRLFSLSNNNTSSAGSTLFDNEQQKNDIIDDDDFIVEEQYTRKSQLEHILLRPNMYVGAVGQQQHDSSSPSYVLEPSIPSFDIASNDNVQQLHEVIQSYLNNDHTNNNNDDLTEKEDLLSNNDTSLKISTEKNDNEEKVNNDHLKKRFITKKDNSTSIPALQKIFDEILVNASDNHKRGHYHGHSMHEKKIDVIIDKNYPFIQISNNGKCIPIQFHRKEEMYIPELLFGNLLTGSNFSDDSHTVDNKNENDGLSNGGGYVGGRHGYGAKLTNIFSQCFIVEIIDPKKQKYYKQIWTNNMKNKSKPIIKSIIDDDNDDQHYKYNHDDDYTTCITYIPDMNILLGNNNGNSNNNKIPDDDYELMCRRVVDIAGTCCSSSFGSSTNTGDGKLQVTLNGYDVSFLPSSEDDSNSSTFLPYSQMYRHVQDKEDDNDNDNDTLLPICYKKLNSKWELCVGPSSTGKKFESISFVNGINTSTRHGTHVNVIAKQLIDKIIHRIKNVDPTLRNIKSSIIKRHLFISINTLIKNPSFDSQMKESLKTSPSNFGSTYNIPDAFINNVLLKELDKGGTLGLIESIIQSCKNDDTKNFIKHFNNNNTKKKKGIKQLSIPKLLDAHCVGPITSNKSKKKSRKTSSPCTLILTEGDSAKTLAVSGLEVIGRDYYGVYPLQGKFLNVRGDYSSSKHMKKVQENKAIKDLIEILGLNFKYTYKTTEERNKLRYQHVMIMTDQDTDGSHIKGLVINFFRHFWPCLLQPPIDDWHNDCANENTNTDIQQQSKSFLSSFVTPLLKATKKDNKKNKDVKSFYTMSEYNDWRSSTSEDEIKKYNIKYYKGLGTSTQEEAKEYFKDFHNHYRPFAWTSEDSDGSLIDMAFDSNRPDERKQWILNTYNISNTTTPDVDNDNAITYEDFVNNELIHFSHADNIRSLPSAIDGLKPSQRKVLYACFKRKLISPSSSSSSASSNSNNEIKVAQLTGYCAEHTAYHHGEASLHSTIIGMAQNFVGSNNVNLLVPSGQFGTRLLGGKDAASPRYIFTCLSPIVRSIFPEEDDALLPYREDDGQIIEPHYYCPVIPMLLVNGCMGIGTGWSSYIPQFNPRDILSYIRSKLDYDEKLLSAIEEGKQNLQPWVRDFQGTIKCNGSKGYLSLGNIEQSGNTILITELPVGTWTDDYKTKVLLRMREKGDIVDFIENHTTKTVNFEVKLTSKFQEKVDENNLHDVFKLTSSLNTRNMNAFDSTNTIQKFANPESIINECYFPIRLELYHDRKSVLVSEMNYKASMLRNKARFIAAVTTDRSIDLVSGKQSKDETICKLKELEFLPLSKLTNIRNDNRLQIRHGLHNGDDLNSDSTSSNDNNTTNNDYDYLLNMPLSSLTSEKIQGLHKEASLMDDNLRKLQTATPEDLWKSDLAKLENHLGEYC